MEDNPQKTKKIVIYFVLVIIILTLIIIILDKTNFFYGEYFAQNNIQNFDGVEKSSYIKTNGEIGIEIVKYINIQNFKYIDETLSKLQIENLTCPLTNSSILRVETKSGLQKNVLNLKFQCDTKFQKFGYYEGVLTIYFAENLYGRGTKYSANNIQFGIKAD